jgi:hypothetical protein
VKQEHLPPPDIVVKREGKIEHARRPTAISSPVEVAVEVDYDSDSGDG